jgi:hypothetical protein
MKKRRIGIGIPPRAELLAMRRRIVAFHFEPAAEAHGKIESETALMRDKRSTKC